MLGPPLGSPHNVFLLFVFGSEPRREQLADHVSNLLLDPLCGAQWATHCMGFISLFSFRRSQQPTACLGHWAYHVMMKYVITFTFICFAGEPYSSGSQNCRCSSMSSNQYFRWFKWVWPTFWCLQWWRSTGGYSWPLCLVQVSGTWYSAGQSSCIVLG